MILDGKTLVDCQKFFEQFQESLPKGLEIAKDYESIHITSFRKIKQYDVMNILKIFAWKANKQFVLFNADKERISVSPDQVANILREFHDAPLGGHVGAKRMHHKIKQLYVCPNMRRDIENYVRQCDSSQKNKICRMNRIPMRITTTCL